MKTTTNIALWSLALVALGCGGEAVDCTFTEAASVVLGGGTVQTGFLALNDNDVMTVVLGPQGLYMVTPSVRVRGMYPGVAGRRDGNDPLIEIKAYLNDVEIGSSAREHLGLTQTANGDEGLGIFMPFTVVQADYLNQSVLLRGTVSDACGRSANDELTIVVVQ